MRSFQGGGLIIDTHCHLDDERYLEDLDAVLSRALDRDVRGFLIPGADPKTLQRAIDICEQYQNCYFAVGFHPYDASAFDIAFLEEYSSHQKCIAIGECGLDYYRLPESADAIAEEKALQKEVFIKQIEFAKRIKKPLIIHIRESSQASYEILLEQNAQDVGGVLHCYNADEILLKLAEKNFYYGIGGVITFKNAKKLPEVLKKIPLEKLLVETDAPYLTPHPFRGERNEPSYCNHIVEKIAEILEIEKSALEEITTRNATSLFREFSTILK